MTTLSGADKAAGTAQTAHPASASCKEQGTAQTAPVPEGTVCRSPKEPQPVGPGKRRKIMNSLYWFSSQKHQDPPWHLGNLIMRVTKPWEGRHISIPALKNGCCCSGCCCFEAAGAQWHIRNLLAFLQGSPAVDLPGRPGGHTHTPVPPQPRIAFSHRVVQHLPLPLVCRLQMSCPLFMSHLHLAA